MAKTKKKVIAKTIKKTTTKSNVSTGTKEAVSLIKVKVKKNRFKLV